jgi:GT2 family glycosyltransferase
LSSVWIDSAADLVPAPVDRPGPPDDGGRILVVIPTRDQPGLLRSCVDSLRAFAERPDALDILVVDNRSVEDETKGLLDDLSARAGVEILTLNEPFNWARLNTVAAQGQSQPLIVFANNDIEAIARGWDGVVRRELARPDVGVVGARLLYGDQTLQHGGVVLGAAEGRPIHEGQGAGPLEDGPMGRWRRTRPVAAVTGAFMAVRRETFERLGGFDDRLAVGYNDIDFCLRARGGGLRVIYAADLTLIHRESRTRGLNDSAEKIAWDDTELKRLHGRWGSALFQDPGVNPHWASASGRPLDGYRDPTLTQVLAWLDHSVRNGPWCAGVTENSGV